MSCEPRLVLLPKHLNRWIRHQEFNGRQVAIRSSLSNLSKEFQNGGSSHPMPGKSRPPAPCSTSEVRISDTSAREKVPSRWLIQQQIHFTTFVKRNGRAGCSQFSIKTVRYSTSRVHTVPQADTIFGQVPGRGEARDPAIMNRSEQRASSTLNV